ncbi:MAG: HD domain-containing protein [Anaerolineaceae bacterium]|nr:HD domain-containing protein [Anaerolineaceae bacterium]
MTPAQKIPSLAEAASLMAEAESRNHGPWVQHSLYAAQAAKLLAAQLPGLDPEAAYVLGILHDIGRRAGVTDMRHTLDGYTYLTGLGFDGAAQICLTHSFPFKNIYAGAGKWDCSEEELQLMEKLLEQVEYSQYDRLIQLCDSLALPSGYCLVEKRLVDVALRHGTNPYTIQKWQAFLAIQQEFEGIIGHSIYSFLPGVIDNTFGLVSSASSLSSGAPNGPSTSAAARKSSSL